MEYRGKNNERVLAKYDTGLIKSPKRWQPLSDQRKAPIGTKWIRVRLLANRKKGTTNDACFDQLHLSAVPANPSGTQPDSGILKGPYAYLSAASVSIPPLGLTFTGGFTLTEQRVRAWLKTRAFRRTGLLEVSAGSWQIHYQKNKFLDLSAKPSSIKILGKTMTPPSSFAFSVQSNGSFSASCRTTKTLPLIPEMFELGPSQLTLSRDRRGKHSLTLKGKLLALKNWKNQWLIRQGVTLSASDGPFEAPLPGFANKTFINLTGLLNISTISTSSLKVGRDVRGAFYLNLRGLQVKVLEQTPAMSLNGKVTTAGALSLSWKGSKRFKIGPFVLISQGNGSVAFNMLRASLAVKVAGGKLKSAYHGRNKLVPGWPAAGVDIPGVNFNTAGDFEVKLTAFTFNGIKLQSTGWGNYIKLKRKNRVVSVEIRNRVRFLGATLSMALDVKSTGRVSGKVSGSLKIDNPFGPGGLDFGSISMSYDNSRTPFQFQTTQKLGFINYRLKFGSGGAGIDIV